MTKKILNKKFQNLNVLSCILLTLITFDMVQSCQGCILELNGYLKYLLIGIELLISGILIILDYFKEFKLYKKHIVYAILVILSLISTLLSHSRSFLYTILICWIIRNENLEDVLKFEIKALSVVMIIVVIGYLLTTYIFKTNVIDYSREKSVRAIGFGHSNYLGIFAYNIVLMYLYVKNKTMNKKYYLYIIVFSLIIFIISDCKSSLILSIITILLFISSNYLGLWYKNLLKFAAKYSFIFLGIIFFLIMYLYMRGTSIGLFIDNLLTGRVFLACDALYTWGISLFGQYVSNLKESYYQGHFIIETIFPYLLTYYGVIWLPLFSILIPKSIKKGEVRDYILMIIFSIYGLSEHAALNFVFVCSLLLFKNLFSDGGVLDE